MPPVLNNLGVKMGAIGVALLLWLHVVTEKTYTYTFQASLKPTHLAENLVVANELPRHLQVKIRGKGKRLFWLMFSEIKIILDLQDTIQSKARFRLKVSDVVIPRDLDVTPLEIMEPDYVDVDIDRLVVKRVPVWPRLEVAAADGYVVVGSVEATPDSATLSGPKRFVGHVDTLLTQPVRVQRAKRRVHRELALAWPEGRNVTLRPTKVAAEVDVQRLKRRVVNDIPVVLLHVPSNKKVTLDSSTITLTVEGGAELLASLTSEDFRVSVDYRQARRRSTEEVTPVILTPPNVTWIDAQPRTFRIID
ncbi:MAG: YbbR-like domain-containing protein [bacterium]